MGKSFHRAARAMCMACMLCSNWTLSVWADQPTTVATAADQLESYVDGLVAAQFADYDLAGLTLVVVRDNAVVLSKGYGFADLAQRIAVDPERHLFRPGSVSKLITWTAVMQLVEAGQLDLHADLSRYVDQFEIPNRFDTPMTMAHLLTHTPGLEDGFAGYLFAEQASDNLPLAESLARYIPAQVRKPGTDAAYSNWATALAGLVVANISGMPFETYVDEHIFKPLGMQQATFAEPLPQNLAADMATGYVMDNGELTPFGFEYIGGFGPAGAMSASADALARFMLAHLNQGAWGEARILQAETVATMHQRLFSHHPAVAGMAHGFIEAWHHGRRFIGHGGDTIAFHSELVLDPENGFGVFLSFNAPDGAEARDAIIDGIIDHFYAPADPVWNYPRLEGDTARAQEVAGAYRFNRRSYSKLEGIIALGGDLVITPAGENSIFIPGEGNSRGKFYEVEPYVYEKPGRQARVVFKRDAAGTVTQLLLGSVPVLVGDRVGVLDKAANHQLVIGLTVLAGIFVLINSIRNRRLALTDVALLGRRVLTWTAVCNLVFIVALTMVLSGIDPNRIIFDFPPTGLSYVLILPYVSLALTIGCLINLLPVWKAEQCGIWARLRYTYVTGVFVLFMLVLNYWNLIGWNYF